jgi:hypothetical protein
MNFLGIKQDSRIIFILKIIFLINFSGFFLILWTVCTITREHGGELIKSPRLSSIQRRTAG